MIRKVLKGAMRMLGRCKPHVVFEQSLGAADCHGTSPEMVFDFLPGCSLRVSLVRDWLAANE